MSFRILWPESREVSDEQIQGWARDAVANQEINVGGVDLDDAADCARSLHEAGLITLHRGS